MGMTSQVSPWGQDKQLGARIAAHLPEVFQALIVPKLHSRRPNESERRGRPELQEAGLDPQSGHVTDAASVYCDMTDEEGRKYSIVVCACKSCRGIGAERDQ